MKMRTIYILGFLIFLLTGCSNSYEYWEISKFHIDTTVLKDKDEIKILYTSRGPDNNKELKYYIHLVAVSQKTGDTVNILTTVENGITMDDKDKSFNYFDQNNVASKLIQLGTENIKNIKNIDDINKIGLKKIDKVARDPKFDNIADNKYPTVIGSIGKLTPNENK